LKFTLHKHESLLWKRVESVLFEVLPLPRTLSLPPRKRKPKDIEHIKRLCDIYYQGPPVTSSDIQNARIHEIYIIDVDRLRVQEMDPEAYMKRALHKGVIFTLKDEAAINLLRTTEEKREDEKLDYYTKQ
jgi:hypothetical protein